MSTVESRLSALGLTLPKAAAPVANYVPTVITGNLLVISGQLCFGPDGKLAPSHIGKLGGEVTAEEGVRAAQLCGLNVLAQAKAALGDLERITRCVRLGGFINAVPTYAGLPVIMNGASDLMGESVGEIGQ